MFWGKVTFRYLFFYIEVEKWESNKNLNHSDELPLLLCRAGDISGNPLRPDDGPHLVHVLRGQLAPAPGGQLPVKRELLEDKEVPNPQNMGALCEHRDIEEPVVISCSDWKDEQRYWPAALKQSTSGKYLQTSQHTFSPVRTWTLQRSQAEEIHCRWRICHLSPRAAPRQPLQHPRQDGE